MQQPLVIKIGGHELESEAFLVGLSQAVAALDAPVILVHGGGKEISHLQTVMGIEPVYLDGVRVTDAASLSIVEMVLCGIVNKRLVRHLVVGGVDAQGMCGVDRGLIRAQKMPHAEVDMGYTGEVTEVRGEVLRDMLAHGVTPVIAPICLGENSSFNVNADYVAGAVAAAVGAARVVFVTNVPGVLVDDDVVHHMTPAQARQFIAAGVIYGGMIPKVETALHVLAHGVSQAAITNLEGLTSHGGTVFAGEMG